MNALVKFAIVSALLIGIGALIQQLIPEALTTTLTDSVVYMLNFIYKLDDIIPAAPLITSIKLLFNFMSGVMAVLIVFWIYESYKG